jgi:hypothetical protein
MCSYWSAMEEISVYKISDSILNSFFLYNVDRTYSYENEFWFFNHFYLPGVLLPPICLFCALCNGRPWRTAMEQTQINILNIFILLVFEKYMYFLALLYMLKQSAMASWFMTHFFCVIGFLDEIVHSLWSLFVVIIKICFRSVIEETEKN